MSQTTIQVADVLKLLKLNNPYDHTTSHPWLWVKNVYGEKGQEWWAKTFTTPYPEWPNYNKLIHVGPELMGKRPAVVIADYEPEHGGVHIYVNPPLVDGLEGWKVRAAQMLLRELLRRTHKMTGISNPRGITSMGEAENWRKR